MTPAARSHADVAIGHGASDRAIRQAGGHRRCPIVTAKIIAALPAHDAPHISPNDIHREIDLGAVGTVRHVLRALVSAGVASSILIEKTGRRPGAARLYRKAPPAT